MLLILVVAVVSVPAVDGKNGHLRPVSYQTTCDRYSCQTVTDGILETADAGISASWPNVVPLGRSFQVRKPVWRWGLGLALIDNDKTAVIAVLVSLLIEGFAVLVVVKLVRLTRNWRRHRQQPLGAEPELATGSEILAKPTTRNPRLCRPRPVPPQVYKG